MATPLTGTSPAATPAPAGDAGRERFRARLAIAAVVAGAAYALIALLGSIGYGYTTNGDFRKYNRSFVAGPAGDFPPPPESAEAWSEAFQERGWHRYWTLRGDGPAPAAVPGTGTTAWLWAGGRAVHALVRPGPTLDLVYLGLLPRLLVLGATIALATAVALDALERRASAPLLAIAPWALLLTASSMTAYFNSFYRETGTFVFAALLVASIALAPRLGGWGVAAILATGALLVGSAPVHGPLALVVAWAAIDVARRPSAPRSRLTRGTRQTAALAFGVAAVLALGLWRPAALEGHVRQAAAFNALFLGMLPLSDDVAGHLARLGLPADAERWVGHFAYEPEARRWRSLHQPLPSHRRLASLVLREPRLAPRMLASAAGLVNQTSVRGRNLDAEDHPAGPAGSAGPASRRPARWNGWGELQARWLPTGIGYLLAVAAAALVGFVARAGEDRGRAATGRLVIACAAASALEVVVKYAADGPTATWRHLAAANFFFGACVVSALWLALQGLAARRAQSPAS